MTGAGRKAWLVAELNARIMALWQGPRPSALARLLQPLSCLYAALADGHQALYRLGLRRAEAAPMPLLVVGNLVAGGAGKTPTVLALIALLRQQGWTPGVVSRGHGRRGGEVRLVTRSSQAAEVGDEPLLIHLRTAAPVAVGADRAAAARTLCASHPEVDLLVADDGLQHHRLKHDMVLLVFDERGVGNGLRLPAGPLRQALPSGLPPHTLVLYSAGRPSTALPGLTGKRQLGGVLPLEIWWQGAAAGTDQNLDAGWAGLRGRLRGRRLLAAAGLARPEPFFAMLEARGLQIDRLPLADHHRFDPLPWPAGTAEVIVTEKDAVKLPPASVGATRVWVATLDFQLEPAFDAALRTLCAPFRRPHEP
jgi:tetraacyldisaccharide 4'-kinase